MGLFRLIRETLWRATRHWVSFIGVVLTTLSAMLFVVLFVLSFFGAERGPYAGLLTYLLLPTIFAAGLVLMPIGLAQLRKKERAGIATTFPVLDFNRNTVRNGALVFLAVTVFNVALLATATYKGLEVMHHDSFCGGSCHTVMQPEAVAHSVTMHANVGCADCHVGEGAGHFVKAKFRGATQLLQFMTNDMRRPIPGPTEVDSVICTRCHQPDRFIEDRLHIRRTYSEDEQAVEKTTVYRMRVGGFRDGHWSGSHGHLGRQIRYLSDPLRRNISSVEVTRPDGTHSTFTVKAETQPADAAWHEMGCTDCHSRPAHRLSSPETVVNQALARGAIDHELPFIAKGALEVLKAQYPSHDAALIGIPQALTAFYARQVPSLPSDSKPKVDAAGQLLAVEWTHNNFPDMKVTWGSYTDSFQHEQGCFRCHDKKHADSEGQVIQQKCSGACHDVLATEEEKPEVLDVLYP